MRRIVGLGAATLLVMSLSLAVTASAGAAASVSVPGSSPVIGASSVNDQDYSANWSGYVATGSQGAFNHASASWTVPDLIGQCPAGQSSFASQFVGLDGFNSSTVEQTGTDGVCQNGTPTYFAWFEVYPKQTTVCSFTVSKLDSISASVDFNNGSFTVSLTDGANQCGTTFVLRRAQRSSAEVIVEAPSSNHSVKGNLPLADFGTASFTGAQVNSSTLTDASPSEVIMTTTGQSTGIVKADPEHSLSDGSFSVTWKHA
jgi:hypothetical protein